MNKKLIEEIQLRLKAPAVALEKIVEGKHLPKIFAKAALEELNKALKIVEKLV